MPRGDGTGPMGMGSMTGRGAGYCTGAAQPGFAGARYGFGQGLGLGRRCGANWGPGFGYGRGWWAGGQQGGPMAVAPAAEKQWLTSQAAALQAELDRIKGRLAAMDKPDNEAEK
ncbi:DUF5320 domain-containing protein [Desulfobulbus propionicus]